MLGCTQDESCEGAEATCNTATSKCECPAGKSFDSKGDCVELPRGKNDILFLRHSKYAMCLSCKKSSKSKAA